MVWGRSHAASDAGWSVLALGSVGTHIETKTVARWRGTVALDKGTCVSPN
jgi:hypothetical protein